MTITLGTAIWCVIILGIACFLTWLINLPVGGVGAEPENLKFNPEPISESAARRIMKDLQLETNDALYNFKKRVGREPSAAEIRDIVDEVVDYILDKVKKGNYDADKKS